MCFANFLFSTDFEKEGTFTAIVTLESSGQEVSEGQASSDFVREVWKYKSPLPPLFGQAPLSKAFSLVRVWKNLSFYKYRFFFSFVCITPSSKTMSCN